MIRIRKLGFAAQVGAVVGVIYLAGSSSPSSPQAQGADRDGRQDATFVSGEVLIQYRAGASDAAKQRARGRVARKPRRSSLEAPAGPISKGDLELARVPPGIAIAAAARDLEADPAVEFAEPNWIYEHQATSNDTYYTNGQLWGMYGDVDYARRISTAARRPRRGRPDTSARSSVYVGIIDEGIQFTHPDLGATSGPTRSTRSTASTTTATATSTTSTAGTSTATTTRSTTAASGQSRRPRHARRRHHRRQGRQRRRRRRRQLERHADLRQVPRPAAAARPRTRSRRSTTSPT